MFFWLLVIYFLIYYANVIAPQKSFFYANIPSYSPWHDRPTSSDDVAHHPECCQCADHGAAPMFGQEFREVGEDHRYTASHTGIQQHETSALKYLCNNLWLNNISMCIWKVCIKEFYFLSVINISTEHIKWCQMQETRRSHIPCVHSQRYK